MKTSHPFYLSLVIPFYNEAKSLRELSTELEAVLKSIGKPSEIIFVDDGSTDGGSQTVLELQEQNSSIKLIRFRRNLGKSAALQYGFKRAKGEIVISMDADLQDDPNEIPQFLDLLAQGYDLVSGRKVKRQDSWGKRAQSKIYNQVTRWMTGVQLHDFNCGFKAYRRQVLKEIEIYGEMHRFIPVLVSWRGFKIGEIPVHHRPRIYGKSKFGMWNRFLPGVLDLCTSYYVTRYSTKPSRIFGTFGWFSFFAGLAIDFHLLWIKLTGGAIHPHYPYMVLGGMLTIVGIQLIFFGLLSELIVFFYHRFKKEYAVDYERGL